MAVCIEVTSLEDDQDISFQNLDLFHASCTPALLRKHRDPATNAYSLRCDCGLEMELFEGTGALEEIKHTAIDGLPRKLTPGSFSCNKDDTVTIISRSIA